MYFGFNLRLSLLFRGINNSFRTEKQKFDFFFLLVGEMKNSWCRFCCLFPFSWSGACFGFKLIFFKLIWIWEEGQIGRQLEGDQLNKTCPSLHFQTILFLAQGHRWTAVICLLTFKSSVLFVLVNHTLS